MQKHVRWIYRCICIIVSYSLLMFIDIDGQNTNVTDVYTYILKAFGCISLFFVANLIKRLLAKMMALKFNGSNQRAKMEQALKKVR